MVSRTRPCARGVRPGIALRAVLAVVVGVVGRGAAVESSDGSPEPQLARVKVRAAVSRTPTTDHRGWGSEERTRSHRQLP